MTNICECCGKSFRKRLLPDAYLGNHCHDCSFWLKKQYLGEEDKERQAIIDGTHYMYMVTNEDEYLVFRGFGGREFHILFDDGREVRTTNLWVQGEIPQEFRPLLPDNAMFIPVEVPQHSEINDGSGLPF